ncbi:hypothetical protein GQ54DRAFT_299363 [Martensiomyces pterosporus]|nr:hypothetical protein GQ54DRAFT_299363 [Martensiomyces pterosporus]
MPKKQLTVGVPAVLSLRAELERACSESKSGKKPQQGKRPLKESLERQNKGVQERATRDMLSAQPHESSNGAEPTHARAKQALEEKAKIYELLSSVDGIKAAGNLALDGPRIAKILDESSVDFAGKQMAQLRRTHNEGSSYDGSSSSDSSMVEIIDEFGRSRMVPRDKARVHQRQSSDGSSSCDSSADSDSEAGVFPPLLPASRDRSVGHYKLSSDAGERERQLVELHALHENTTVARKAATASISERQRRLLDRRWEQIHLSVRRSAQKTAARPPKRLAARKQGCS